MAPHLVESVVNNEYDTSENSALISEDEDPRFKNYDSEVLDRKYIDEPPAGTPVKARLNPRTGTVEIPS